MIDVKFSNVSKRYRIRREAPEETTRHPVVRKLSRLLRGAEDFWALKQVSFEVERGEALGIIGHNGAGKSTILKLLASITTPTSGEIHINGRLAALIEVGSGFHPELTGRENIYLNGSILGMRRREITDKLDSIVEFAGVRQFIDAPVKRFSSGMYVRLGFSIAAHLDPDILLLDEVLAVGDSAFQAKCLQRIDELKKLGTTIVFISHDLGAVERACDRVLLMKSGEIVKSGTPREVIHSYESDTYQSNSSNEVYGLDGDRSARIEALTFHRSDGGIRTVFHTGERLEARIEFEVTSPVEDVVFRLDMYSPDGYNHSVFTSEGEKLSLAPGRGTITFVCPELGLMPGIYYTDVSVNKRYGLQAIHIQFRSTTLRVDPGSHAHGNFYMPHNFYLTRHESSYDSTSSQTKVGPSDVHAR